VDTPFFSSYKADLRTTENKIAAIMEDETGEYAIVLKNPQITEIEAQMPSKRDRHVIGSLCGGKINNDDTVTLQITLKAREYEAIAGKDIEEDIPKPSGMSVQELLDAANTKIDERQ